MPSVHVHIYQVVAKAEIDFEETPPIQCKEKALEMAKNGELEFKQADCTFLAVHFEID